MTLYKITHPDGAPITAEASAVWPLPTAKRPGRWTPDIKPRLCHSGWHLMPVEGLSSYIAIGTLFEAEGRGESVGDVTKTAFTSARLVAKVGEITHPVLVGLACDWAEHVQPDPVPSKSAAAIAAARMWALCPCEEHRQAAKDAAKDAAYVAKDAAYAAYAHAYAAAYAAYVASAAYAHAAAAAYAAAYAASAAKDAAYAASAAKDAAYAAYVAKDAAYAAAKAVAKDAAERLWQGERVLEVVGS